MPAIEVRDLCRQYKVYRKREGLWGALRGVFRRDYEIVSAVRNVSFQIDSGEMVAFLGPNGAGKTTTLKLLSGLVVPTSGTATVLGHVPWLRENAYRRRFSLVTGQKEQLWWDLPAQESFRLHQEIYRIPPADYAQRLGQLTELLDVVRLLSRPVRELSLGERMRMELIAALLHRPEVLFLDEPTIGLDVVSQRRVQDFLRTWQQEHGITVILTSHYMKDVEALCRRAVIINQGQVIHDGPLAAILDRFSRHKIVELQFTDNRIPDDLSRYGRLLETRAARVRLQVEKQRVSAVLAGILDKHSVDDISVLERPLEDVIAELFAVAGEAAKAGGS
ncbi:MAG: putative transporter ATP-binding protein YbhF [Planctomycetota bacterium]|jgi:ABC-2 type transport system ATP-binding protein